MSECVLVCTLQEQLDLLQGTGMEEEVDQDRQRFAYFWTHHVRPLLEDALGKAWVPEGEAFQAIPIYICMYLYLNYICIDMHIHIYIVWHRRHTI